MCRLPHWALCTTSSVNIDLRISFASSEVTNRNSLYFSILYMTLIYLGAMAATVLSASYSSPWKLSYSPTAISLLKIRLGNYVGPRWFD